MARSALMSNIGSSVGETLSKVDLAAQGLKGSALGIPGSLPRSVHLIFSMHARFGSIKPCSI